METHLAHKQPVQVKKTYSLCEIYSGPTTLNIARKIQRKLLLSMRPCVPTKREIMRRKLDSRDDPNRGVTNFTGRIKGMHIFIGNFTYVTDFMIVEVISSIIYPRLSQVVLGKPFVEMFTMIYDLSKGVVRFTNKTNEITYKMPHKIEQYNSLPDLEKDHTKLVYLRNEEDKRRGAEYVMSKILGFYKECLELGPKYLTGVADEGEIT
uniref:Protein kinase-like domain, concanavalin A-like lectin/glucanase domain protein n=1 Tax=Tanacetum cinerariifolium TaxID=118510 RepID=A0A699GS11_TANCI|nr:protein kinase-like domain, concanavalin A-like lectin/glucanase domain protein [Tanacetum cinerariifolium]